jgi:hypothetical protein
MLDTHNSDITYRKPRYCNHIPRIDAGTNSKYYEKINELCIELENNDIEFYVDNLFDGYIVYFYNEYDMRDGDIILHKFSESHEELKFEGYAGMSCIENKICVFDSIHAVVEYAKRYKFDE